jgi:Xaa-Pro aminopeptidase
MSMSVVPQQEYADRVHRARALMRKQKVDGLIVTDPVSIYYFAGMKIPAWQKGRPSAFILPLQDEPALVTWSGPEMFARLYKRPLPSWVADRRIYPEAPMTHDEPVDWGIIGVLRDRKLSNSRLAIEMGDGCRLGMPLNDLFLVQRTFPKATFVDSSPIVWGCRVIKSAWEQACSRKACEIGGRAWKRAIAELKPGISSREIQRRILQYYLEEGADLDSEPPTALGGTGAGSTFQKGDILYLDGGCSYMGYRMDFTRRCVFGPPSDRQRAEHDRMWGILFKVMDRMKPGVPVSEIFEYSQSLMAKTNFTNYSNHPAKRIGHGIGLETEPPSLSPFDHRILEPGMIITPEPKIETVEGLLNPEEHIVITNSGYEIFSKEPDWPVHVIQ